MIEEPHNAEPGGSFAKASDLAANAAFDLSNCSLSCNRLCRSILMTSCNQLYYPSVEDASKVNEVPTRSQCLGKPGAEHGVELPRHGPRSYSNPEEVIGVGGRSELGGGTPMLKLILFLSRAI